MSIKNIQVSVTTDGKQFTSEDAAKAHQSILDNAGIVESVSESFVNTATAPGAKVNGLSGRTRVFNKNVCAQTVAFLLSAGVVDADALAAMDAIEPSEELQERLDLEEEKAKAKAAEAKAKAAAKETTAVVEEEVEADDALFAAGE